MKKQMNDRMMKVSDKKQGIRLMLELESELRTYQRSCSYCQDDEVKTFLAAMEILLEKWRHSNQD